jgi:hypothetical protein
VYSPTEDAGFEGGEVTVLVEVLDANLKEGGGAEFEFKGVEGIPGLGGFADAAVDAEAQVKRAARGGAGKAEGEGWGFS